MQQNCPSTLFFICCVHENHCTNVLRVTVLAQELKVAFQNIINSCSKVINGDVAEELELGLKPINVEIPKINISSTEIKVQHKVLSHMAAAGEALRLSIVRDTAMTGVALLNSVNKAAYKTALQPFTVDPAD